MVLTPVFEEARRRGFLGPGPVDAHIAHAMAFVGVLEPAPARVVDLGSGAGVPGLVLAVVWPQTAVVLVDSSHRRAVFLREALGRVGLPMSRVVEARAEDMGRDPAWRGWAAAVTARSFGAPGVTAECAAPLLQAGGTLVVSEPPDARPERWPGRGLACLGLQAQAVRQIGLAHVAVFRQDAPCPDRYPRRPGIPAKRPLF